MSAEVPRAEALADTAFAPVAAALAAGQIPGAVLGIQIGDARAVRVAGDAQIEPVREPMSRATWFDLASLTKVIATTTTLLRLVEAGRVGLDDTLARHVPDLRQYDVAGAAERRLTIRQCLGHATHLPAVEPLYTHGQDAETLKAFVLQRVWRAGPPVYSDIGFILLGILIERVTGRPLDEQELGPGLGFRPDPAHCAATERCTWRGRVIRGTVHDENAHALGGAAGHAGLFGTVDGVLEFAADLMAGRIVAPARLAEASQPVRATRGLGWELPHAGWSGGDHCPAGTIGHTGFTGTGLWLVPQQRLAWTLLTNRVHPTRHRETGIVMLRRAVGDAVMTGS